MSRWGRAGLALTAWLTLLGCSEEQKGGCGECAPPAACIEARCVAVSEALVSQSFGEEPRQFGVESGEEARARAPSSLALSAGAARVFVLDSVNQRISVFAGAGFLQTIPIPLSLADDLVLLEPERIVLMARRSDRFFVLDKAGALLDESPITGAGIAEAGLAGALYARPDGVWLQSAKLFVHVLDPEGAPVATRRMESGLVSRDGSALITLNLLGDGSVHVVRRPRTGLPSYRQAQLVFEQDASHIVAQDTDLAGNIYVATEHLVSVGDEARSKPLLTVLSPELEQLRQVPLSPYDSARDMFRSVAVSSDGLVLQLVPRSEQIDLVRY